jgi:hypothetical protein
MKNPSKQLREEAYRARAGMIGELATCICTYPLEHFETTSGHHETCAAHAYHLSTVEVARRNPDFAIVPQPRPFAVWPCGEGWSARCRVCGESPTEPTIAKLVALMGVEHAHRKAGAA